jgi:hypothetical protein
VLAKVNPGKVNYALVGNGGNSRLIQVQFMAESIPQAARYHKQAKVRVLDVSSRECNAALPDVPTAIKTKNGQVF